MGGYDILLSPKNKDVKQNTPSNPPHPTPHITNNNDNGQTCTYRLTTRRVHICPCRMVTIKKTLPLMPINAPLNHEFLPLTHTPPLSY